MPSVRAKYRLNAPSCLFFRYFSSTFGLLFTPMNRATSKLIMLFIILTSLNVYGQDTIAQDTIRVKNNLVAINALPLSMTQLGYSHIFFNHLGLGANWDYYYPKSFYHTYGIDDGDGNGIYHDIDNKYYTIGESNRFDGCIMYVHGNGYDPSDLSMGFFFIKYTISKFFMNDMWQIYFNQPVNNGRGYYPADTSVTQFLSRNSSNKVYYRQESFTGWGQSLSFGILAGFGTKPHFLAGCEVGLTNEYMPGYAKQPIYVNSQEYYYQYTPSWEGRINYDPVYGHILFGISF